MNAIIIRMDSSKHRRLTNNNDNNNNTSHIKKPTARSLAMDGP